MQIRMTQFSPNSLPSLTTDNMLKDLLAKGYFFSEAPQCFNTKKYSKAIIRDLTILPKEFLPGASGKKKDRSQNIGAIGRHNLARVGNLRRTVGVPNPVTFFNLANIISDDWTLIQSIVSSNNLSTSTPIFDASYTRAIKTKNALRERPQIKLNSRALGRYALTTDIQQFYPSIYTHSIPWAIHGKSIAKAKRSDMTLLGNKLDHWVQYGQDSQTRGIPIGPDTSLVVAEILLAAVDKRLETELGPLIGHRAIDDYELVFPRYSDAERAMAVFQAVLDEFELKPHEGKTKIIELPSPLEDLWPIELNRFEIRSTSRGQRADLMTFFNLAFDLGLRNPTKSVLKYAITKTAGVKISEASWPIYQNLLLHSFLSEPGTAPLVLSELEGYSAIYTLDSDRIADAIRQTIEYHTVLRHGSEIAWSVWMAIRLGVKIPKSATAILHNTSDTLVPLLALHARAENLLDGVLDVSHWESLMTTEELWGPNWLLAYEAKIKNWLPSVGSANHLDKDPCFKFMKDKKISFYDVAGSAIKATSTNSTSLISSSGFVPSGGY